MKRGTGTASVGTFGHRKKLGLYPKSNRKPVKISSSEVTWSDLGFKQITLAVVRRMG